MLHTTIPQLLRQPTILLHRLNTLSRFVGGPGKSYHPSLVSVAKDISPFKMGVISRFSSTGFVAAYMCIVSHTSYEAC